MILTEMMYKKCPVRYRLFSVKRNIYPRTSRLYFSTQIEEGNTTESNDTSDFFTSEKPTLNPVGIQYLSRDLHSQLFKQKYTMTKRDEELIRLAKVSLDQHKLLGKKTTIKQPLSFKLPTLQGKSLDEHFQKIGNYLSVPYKDMCYNKFKNLPIRPKEWLKKNGWMRYEPGKSPEPVDAPLEDTLVFDVETLYKISDYPSFAVAASEKAWYLWCSPFILENNNTNFKHLIPLGNPSKPKLIIGHNISYDRSKVKEEYSLLPSKSYYMDTLSMHISTHGLCSRQRSKYAQTKKLSMEENGEDKTDKTDFSFHPGLVKDDPWLNMSSMNSLRDVALYHCGINLNKQLRDYFADTNKNVILDNFQLLVDYCAMDVVATSKVFDKIYPTFLKQCPHPISFSALNQLTSCILPTNIKEWNDYVSTSENLYQSSKNEIESKLAQIIDDLIKKDANELKKDPWFSQLDWTTHEIRMTKKGEPVKNQKLPGYPEWYRSLFPRKDCKTPQITLKSRIIPLLFQLSWEGTPVIWDDKNGWCFDVDESEKEKFLNKNYYTVDEPLTFLQTGKVRLKIPHPSGPTMNCTTLMSKPYIHFLDKGIMTSRSELAKEALTINASVSYWISARERIMSQFVVPSTENGDIGFIIPKIIPMGTVTRRAVENTWLTASNAKKNRVGSELKSMIKAPKGYCFVGADVDSEELWIASLVGDSVFKIHGGTPIGWMCLEGTKNEGTDLHTKTAQILGCTRNEAKIFNYGRIYGAGVKFAGQLLKSFNPNLSIGECQKVATSLYEETKGKVKRPGKNSKFPKFWYGGSESILFNQLEKIAEQTFPRTPVLGCGLTKTLQRDNLSSINSYLPSRINWCIQSSGVDYLHLLVCSMSYLIEKYSLNARLSITIHDEIRYLAKEEDKYKVALALQVSNIWTRSLFCEQLGIYDLPQNCAFFSAVDIDTILRKEVDMDCITPSKKTPSLPFGESLDIIQLLKECKEELLGIANKDQANLNNVPANEREHVFEEYNKGFSIEYLEAFLHMQLKTKERDVRAIERDYKRTVAEKELKKDKTHEETISFNDFLFEKKKKAQTLRDATINENTTIDPPISRKSAIRRRLSYVEAKKKFLNNIIQTIESDAPYDFQEIRKPKIKPRRLITNRDNLSMKTKNKKELVENPKMYKTNEHLLNFSYRKYPSEAQKQKNERDARPNSEKSAIFIE